MLKLTLPAEIKPEIGVYEGVRARPNPRPLGSHKLFRGCSEGNINLPPPGRVYFQLTNTFVSAARPGDHPPASAFLNLFRLQNCAICPKETMQPAAKHCGYAHQNTEQVNGPYIPPSVFPGMQPRLLFYPQ